MKEFFETSIEPHFNYWVYVILMMIGLWAVIAKNNLIKKLIGMSIFQTAIILFYVSVGVKKGSGIPIIPKAKEAAAGAGEHGAAGAVNPDLFANPLPHVLMLTAIVVGVSTLGVALAVAQQLFKDFGTLEEDEILEQIKTADKASPDG
ncbi:MAG: cation:proton antiporter subunit C [Verrucomicrobiales bacterium]|nr:cation:proton antiporter subunit C [Verrucomicrobiales bacterium]